jgi:hypothetical protein
VLSHLTLQSYKKGVQKQGIGLPFITTTPLRNKNWL